MDARDYGEPWSVVEKGNTVKSRQVVNCLHEPIASGIAYNSGVADRIVACVNALAGVPHERLGDVETLAACVIQLEARLVQMLGVLRMVEWNGYSWVYGAERSRCPLCQRPKTDGHLSSCQLAAALAGEGVSEVPHV